MGLAEETHQAPCHMGSDFRLDAGSHWVQSGELQGQTGAALETRLDQGGLDLTYQPKGGLISLGPV